MESKLVVSFPDQSASFVHGFEAGAAWEKMKRGDVAELELTTHAENREVIRRMADNLGWSVEIKESGTEGWDFTRLTKTGTSRERTNPHGLHVV
jgi:hypothetical protein